ncbi:MAG: hypothetical protein ACREA0_27305 [bacterium]
MGPFRITFDRIGRNHDVEPLLVEKAKSATHLAEQIRTHAKPRLLSRDVEVQVHLYNGVSGEGVILAGFRDAGRFKVEHISPDGAQ